MSNLLGFRDKMDIYDKESLKTFARDLYIGKTSQLRKVGNFCAVMLQKSSLKCMMFLGNII